MSMRAASPSPGPAKRSRRSSSSSRRRGSLIPIAAIPRASLDKTRRVWKTLAGNMTNLRLETEDELGEPGFEEVRVRVHAVGLNFADMFACQGLYSATPEGWFIPGLEFSGVIEALHAGAPEVEVSVGSSGRAATYRVGDRVMGVIRFGGYSTHLITKLHFVRALPPKWSYDEGASFLCQALTAFFGLKEQGNIKPGRSVLVHSAAGGTGGLALSICKRLGCPVVGTVGSEDKVKWIVEHHPHLKSEQIIVRGGGSKEVAKKLDAAMAAAGISKEDGAGFDISLDSLLDPDPAWFWPTYERVGSGGRVVVFGAGSMTSESSKPMSLDFLHPAAVFKLAYSWLIRPKMDPLSMISENKSLMCFNLIWLTHKIEEMNDVLDDLMALGWDDEPPVVGARFPFEQVPEALAFFQSGRSTGKIVIQVSHPESAQ